MVQEIKKEDKTNYREISEISEYIQKDIEKYISKTNALRDRKIYAQLTKLSNRVTELESKMKFKQSCRLLG